MKHFMIVIGLILASQSAQAGKPLWTFTPLTSTAITITPNSTATIQYLVTNQSPRSHRLVMTPIRGITQITTLGNCANPFTLTYQQSCVLTLQVNGSTLQNNVDSGPNVCQDGNPLQCYQPAQADILHIQKSSATSATISVLGSPLTLTTNGATGNLTVTNTSASETAFNITSNFSGTALQGNVTETGNTCASVAPGASCTLTFSAGSSRVPLTFFPIQGSNTNTISAAITVSSLFAYVSNGFSSGANNVTRCEVLNNGSFAGCVTSGTNLTNPTGIVINALGSLAYITNLDTQDVTKCSFDSNGDLTNCTNSGTNLSSPAGIVLNAANTLAYIANAGADNVTKCEFAGNGDLMNCTASGAGMGFPIGAAINPAGTYLYTSNFSNDNVTKCEFDGNGDLTNCSNSGAGLQSPTGVAINAAGTFIYIVNNATLNVSKCQLAGNGDLINCVIAGGTTLSEPRFITFNADESFVYIANALGSNVTQCAVDGAGDFINCVTTGTNMNGATGIQLLLF